MGDLVSFNNTNTGYVEFYEVTNPEGVAVWGGGDPVEAIEFFRQAVGNRLFVSVWEEDGEDAKLIGVPIELTKLITATISNSMERVQQWR
jgi:hypothetical protein